MDKNKSLKRKKSRASTSSIECASYRATLKRTFRFLTVLLVMLIAGSTGAWGQDSEGKIPITVLVDGTVAEETPSALEGPIVTAGGTVDATGYNRIGNCGYLEIVVEVTPNPGYITTLSNIKYKEEGEENYQNFVTIIDGNEENGTLIPNDPASSNNSFGSKRNITVYSKGNTTNTTIQVEFVKVKLTLDHTLGSNAKVTFFDGGTNEPSTATFDPTSYTETSAIASIDNSDGNNRYIIAHIVPETSYWTDAQLLSATDETTASTGSTPAGARSASVRAKAPSEGATQLTLLKADEYDADPSDQVTDMQPRHDGAGWYYYKLPKEHTISTGYTSSTINGEMVKKFDFSLDNKANVSKTDKVISIKNGEGWTAELTLDKIDIPFTGEIVTPSFVGVTIKRDGETDPVFTLTNEADIANHLLSPEKSAFMIGQAYLRSNAKSDYTWFKKSVYGDYVFVADANAADESSHYNIVVPLTFANNAWQINDYADLVMLAKCVNIGNYDFNGEDLKQTANIDMPPTNDFYPIGMMSNPEVSVPFAGNYDGQGFTISNLNYSTSTGQYIGLFGQVGKKVDKPVDNKVGTVKDVLLSGCTFSGSSDVISFVGGIAGNVDNGTISGCMVDAGSVSASKADSYVGAIFGKINANNVTLNNNYYIDTKVSNSTNTSNPLTGYTKRGYWNSTKWDDITTNDGAMLYVKRATIENGTTGNGSAVTFNETITPENATTETPANCYSIDNSTTPVTYWYAPGQEITLSVTEGTIKDGSRTLKEVLDALTMSDGTPSTDIKTSKSFTMPDADATVTPKFKASEWFTVPSNQKKWMTFYHEWKDGNNAANYTVSDGTEGTTSQKTINVWTITAIDAATGGITKKDLGGVSFSGVPTLFNSDDKLPELLKFEPADGKTAPTDVATQFKGVAAETTLSGDNIYVMNGDGEFDHAYLPATSTNTLPANRCYIDLGTNSGARRLFFIEEAVTGIGEVTGVAEVTDHGASLNDKGEMINDKWFTLDGRKLDKLPTKKGLYIYKGKLTVIK